jgi:histidyl-tRNA synthetase
METLKETCYKGTRILLGNEKRILTDNMVDILREEGFIEISIPIIQYQDTFQGKVGEENNNLMFNFKDRGERDLCLAPEYTAVIQKLAKTTFKMEKNLKLFYIQECFRGEKPQAGRYRQFTQLGVEILNPTIDFLAEGYNLQHLALKLLTEDFTKDVNKYVVNNSVVRGLDYYKDGKGFEIVRDELGNAKQICGGGEYDGGVGFAIGIDRLI